MTRTNIERWILVLLLSASYLTRVPGLVRQGATGVPALVVGFIISFVLITLLFRGSAKAALLTAFFAGLSVLGQMIIPMISDVPRPPSMQAALSLCTPIIAAFCSVDLWSQWRKKAEPISHSERP